MFEPDEVFEETIERTDEMLIVEFNSGNIEGMEITINETPVEIESQVSVVGRIILNITDEMTEQSADNDTTNNDNE